MIDFLPARQPGSKALRGLALADATCAPAAAMRPGITRWNCCAILFRPLAVSAVAAFTRERFSCFLANRFSRKQQPVLECWK